MKKKICKKLIMMLLVISMIIPLINYYKQPVEVTGKTSNQYEDVKEQLVLEKEDFSNSPILKYVNEEQFKSKGHIKRLKDQEKLNTYMFENEDGTKTMYMLYENVKYKDKYGNIKDKDITLKEENENYKVKDNNVGLSIPKSPHKGIEVNYDNNMVKIIPIKNNSSAKNATIMENNAVTYKNYYGEGVDLKYTPLLSGVKEDIILTEYIQQEYKFTLETNGLNVYEKEGKYYLAKDETSERIYDIGEVLVYDAVGKPTIGTMLITTKEEGKTYEISISVSDEYLKDETTVYPVTIDPTIKVTDDITGAGNIEDAPVFSGKQTAKCGNYIYLSAGYVDSAHKVGRVVVRTPGLYNSDEYANSSASEIQSVKFYCKDGSGNSSSYVSLYPNTSNATWDEDTISWSTRCNYNDDDDYGTTMSYGGWTCFDITDLVKEWKNGNYNCNMGFTLVNSNETSTSYRKAIFSSEYGVATDRPYVEMTYEELGTNVVTGLTNNTKYYIMNYSSEKFMSLENSTDADFTNVIMNERSTSSLSQWKIELQSTGKYQIVSVNSPTGKCLDASEYGMNIDLYTDNGASYLEFSIQRVNNGFYKGCYIIKYNNYYVSQDSSGNVGLTTSLSEMSYWSFNRVVKRNAEIYSFNYNNNGKQLNTTLGEDVFVMLYDEFGYDAYSNVNEDSTEAFDSLKLSDDIFVFIGHGFNGCITFQNDLGNDSGIISADENIDYELGYNNAINMLLDNQLAASSCVLYLGCYTGADYYDADNDKYYNLVEATYNKGAHYVLGMTGTITTLDACNFMLGFYEAQIDGKNIAGCVNDGLTNAGVQLPIYVVGDGRQFLEY